MSRRKALRNWLSWGLNSQAKCMRSRKCNCETATVRAHWAGWVSHIFLLGRQHSHLSLAARPLTCGVPSECLDTRSYETTSRDQRGKIEMFFSSTGACTATKSPIANHRSPILAQLYFAAVTQMFLMLLFVKVESDSSKLLRTVSKSGPNGCKERSRPQKMLMRIKIESLLGQQNLVFTVTHFHKQPREEQKVIVTWTALIIITKNFKNLPTWL